MSGWREHAVARLDAIGDPGAVGFEIGGGDWPFRGVVVRRGGLLRAYANVCPHRGHPLDALPGRFFETGAALLRCGSHGALFDPDTGLCLVGPCAGQRLAALDCRVVDGEVRVRAPDALAAVWPLPGTN